MKPYPLRTLNHFTVPWTKVAAMTVNAQIYEYPTNIQHMYTGTQRSRLIVILLVPVAALLRNGSSVRQSFTVRLGHQGGL